MAVDEKGGWLYFIASPDDATQRYLYRVPPGRQRRPRARDAGEQPGHPHLRHLAGRRAGRSTRVSTHRPPARDRARAPALAPDGPRRSRTTARSRPPVAPMTRRPPTEFFQVDVGDGVTLDGWMLKPPRLRSDEEVSGAHVRLRRAGRRRGHGRTGAATARCSTARWPTRATSSPASTIAARRRPRAAPGARSSTARSACSRRRSRPRRCARCSRSARTSIPSAWRLGMERRRLDDAEPALPLARPLQGRDGGRAGARPDALRHDLSGTLHGPAAGQRRRLQGRLADQLRRGAPGEAAASSTAPATTTSTSRAPSGSINRLVALGQAVRLHGVPQPHALPQRRATGRCSTCTRCSRGTCSTTCRRGRSNRRLRFVRGLPSAPAVGSPKGARPTAPHCAAAPAARTSSLPSVRRLFAPRTIETAPRARGAPAI